jgi:hypothetical protein
VRSGRDVGGLEGEAGGGTVEGDACALGRTSGGRPGIAVDCGGDTDF